ncbi:hypothetical protein AVEN_73120-1, partial [Araneus ventricosus]
MSVVSSLTGIDPRPPGRRVSTGKAGSLRLRVDSVEKHEWIP